MDLVDGHHRHGVCDSICEVHELQHSGAWVGSSGVWEEELGESECMDFPHQGLWLVNGVHGEVFFHGTLEPYLCKIVVELGQS